MELSIRGRIGVAKEAGGRSSRRAYQDRYTEILSEKNTGEVLLDETLKVMKMDATTPRPASPPSAEQTLGRQSIASWIDLLSGRPSPFRKLNLRPVY
jgi:Golgi phosphoprotein 3